MAFDYRKEFHRYSHYYQRLEPALQKPKTAAYTMVILSFLTISFFGIFVIRPTLTTITSLFREIEDNELVSKKLEEKITALITVQGEYQKIEDDLPLIYKSVPKTPNFPLLLQEIEKLSQEYEASLSTLQFQSLPLIPLSASQATDSSTYTPKEAEPFTFAISLTADYPHVTGFIERLLGVSRLIIINQLEIKSVQDAQLDLNLHASSFYLP